MTDRQELIRNAVVFLTDPKTQGSSVAQKIQFLEAKGLTSPEIDIALKQASSNQSIAQPYTSTYSPVYGPSPYSIVPPSHQWDWRDSFITAVVSGTVAYGAVTLFKKFLLPHLQPPSSSAYEADRDALTAQFDAAEALLKEIQAETAAIRVAMEDQKEKVDQATQDVQAVVKEMREGETKSRDEMREIRDEITNIQEMLPKMIDKAKDTQTQSLTELQQELKSLKALLLSRGNGLASSPVSPLPTLPTRPSIPSWQLAPTPTSAGSNHESMINSHVLSNGKGKEVAAPEASGDSP